MKALFAIAFLDLILSFGLSAQKGESDVGEASVYAGPAFGVTGASIAVAGSLATVVNRYLVVAMESGYTPMGHRTLRYYPGVVSRRSGLYDFNLAAQIRVPLKSKWEPYGILAPALIYNRFQSLATHVDGSEYYFSASDVKFGFETGGGTRYYLRELWGLKGEYRYTISTRNFSSLVFGIFRQF
jgi:opacity protein-like surface antigen